MAKIYSVEGSSVIHPGQLPAGFTIKEKEAPKGGTAHSLYNTEFKVSSWSYSPAVLSLDIQDPTNAWGVTPAKLNKLFTREEALKLRDAINDVLGESGSKLRIITDRDGDKWFEVAPDDFIVDSTRVNADQRHANFKGAGRYGCTFEDVSAACGIKNVTVG